MIPIEPKSARLLSHLESVEHLQLGSGGRVLCQNLEKALFWMPRNVRREIIYLYLATFDENWQSYHKASE